MSGGTQSAADVCRDARSLMILRPDNIGDCIIFSGALCHIRQHWPAARIDLYVQPHIRPLFAHCPHVDRVRSLSRLQPWELLRRHIARGSWWVERSLLRPGVRRWWLPRYDVVLYPVSAPTEEGLRTVSVVRSRVRAGYSGEQLRLHSRVPDELDPGRLFTHAFENTCDNRWLHERERTMGWLRMLGMDVAACTPEVWLTEQARKRAAALLPHADTLGLFVGASSDWRRWPAEKWAALVARQDRFAHIVVMGTRADRDTARVIQSAGAAAQVEVVDLTGRTSLPEFAACIARCAAAVSNDSAGLHVAVASGVPAVGILGGYHFGRYYPWGNPEIHRVACVRMDCFHCNDDCRYGDWRCVCDITLDAVLSELNQAVDHAGTVGAASVM